LPCWGEQKVQVFIGVKLKPLLDLAAPMQSARLEIPSAKNIKYPEFEGLNWIPLAVGAQIFP
jgi:hypothetical protein